MANGNPYAVTPALAFAQPGLGQLGQAIGQSFAGQRQQEDKRAKAQQFMQLVQQAQGAQDPAQKQQLMTQAFVNFPEQAQRLRQQTAFQREQAELEQVGQPKAITPAERERFRIEDEKLKFRQLEVDAQNAATNLERKKLENQIKLQGQKIAKNEREALAAEKGPSAQELLGKAKEGEKKAASFADRMNRSYTELNRLEQTIDPTDRFIPIIAGGEGVIAELANRQASPEEQQYATAASDFVTAQLRKESGAVIGAEEFQRKYREFFPVPGDSDAQIESKRQRREAAAQNMVAESGGLYDVLYGADSDAAAPAQQAESQYTEGMTATNPQTGERLIFRGGQWQTLQHYQKVLLLTNHHRFHRAL